MLSESTPNSERDALAKVLFAWDTSENTDHPTWDGLDEYQRVVWRGGADAVLAAGYRRQEGEWEWTVRSTYAPLGRTWTCGVTDEDTARVIFSGVMEGAEGVERVLLRRRPAGPWVPVTEEGTEHATDL